MGAPLETAAEGDERDWWSAGDMVVVVIWVADQWHKQVRVPGAKSPKPSCQGSVTGAPLENAAGGDERGGWSAGDMVVVVIWVADRWHKWVRVFGAKSPKPGSQGSVTGAPLGTAARGDGRG